MRLPLLILTTWITLGFATYVDAQQPGDTEFIPYFHDDFESYEDGVSLSANKPFDAAGRTTASAEKAYRGRQSARMAIDATDRGGFGRWGGVIPIRPALPKGSEVWVRLYVYWPDDFQFSASPWMKFIRLHNRTGDGKNGGYNDIYIDKADGEGPVFRTIKEGQNRWKTYEGPAIPRNRWERYEVYLSIDDRPVDAGGQGRFRVWRDGRLIFDRTDVPTISAADGTIDSLYLFTYWNNEQPPTQNVFVDDLTIATSASPPPNRDADGNRCVGNWGENERKQSN